MPPYHNTTNVKRKQMLQNLTKYTCKHLDLWKGGDSSDDYDFPSCTLPTNICTCTSVVDAVTSITDVSIHCNALGFRNVLFVRRHWVIN